MSISMSMSSLGAIESVTTTQIHLPQDVIENILVRLPPKALVRFKSVCKTWHALIDTSFFINRHLDFINVNSTITDHCHLIHRHDFTPTTPCLSSALLSGPTKQIVNLEGLPCLDTGDMIGMHGHEMSRGDAHYEDGEEWFGTSIWGPINGLYCIMIKCKVSGGCTVQLWNPGNRQVHVPPPIPTAVLPYSLQEKFEIARGYLEEIYLVCGYGYDTTSNDYKVLLTTVYGSEFISPCHFSTFHLYSLGTDTWEQLHPLEVIGDNTSLVKVYEDGGVAFHHYIVSAIDCGSWHQGVYSNGACHWLYNDDVNQVHILSFDFGGKAFQVTSFPEAVLPKHRRYDILATAHNRLVIVRTHETSPLFDLYVMREHGVGESLIRAYRITLRASTGWFLGIVDNEFFVQEADGNTRVVSYHLSAAEPQQEPYVYCHVSDARQSQILPYRGSLVPVKPNKRSSN